MNSTLFTVVLVTLTLLTTPACAIPRPVTAKKAKSLVLRYTAAKNYGRIVSLSKKGKVKFSYKKTKIKVRSGADLKSAFATTPYPELLGKITSLKIEKKSTKKGKRRYIMRYTSSSGKYGVKFVFRKKKGKLYLKKIKVWEK